MLHELQHLGAGGLPPVDDEARVLFRNLGIADAIALEPAALDELTGKVPLRPLEDAPCSSRAARRVGMKWNRALVRIQSGCS